MTCNQIFVTEPPEHGKMKRPHGENEYFKCPGTIKRCIIHEAKRHGKPKVEILLNLVDLFFQ